MQYRRGNRKIYRPYINNRTINSVRNQFKANNRKDSPLGKLEKNIGPYYESVIGFPNISIRVALAANYYIALSLCFGS